jgi:hypothetical protein
MRSRVRRVKRFAKVESIRPVCIVSAVSVQTISHRARGKRRRQVRCLRVVCVQSKYLNV